MRHKAPPKMIDTENFVPSQFTQDPFAPSQQPPTWDDGGTQSTSTPKFPRQSQTLFGSDNPLSPISFSNSGYVSDGYKSDKYENNQQSQDMYDGNRSIQSVVSGYQSDQYEYNRPSQDMYERNRTSQPSGYLSDQYEHPSQNISERNDASQISGYQSGGVDRFNSINRTRGGRIKKRVSKKRKQGVGIEREIRDLQRTTNSLLKMAPFARVVKETISKVSGGKSFRVQSEAVQALMQASEAFLLTLFEASYMCSHHAKRVTLKVEDVQLVRRILATFGTTF
uniref:Histone H2A/H2B/H3 domain-containing protein n=1 Tax=Panagrolaimus sp. ES5 TaxID=591445 RepID=A0AC34FE40_9BILA